MVVGNRLAFICCVPGCPWQWTPPEPALPSIFNPMEGMHAFVERAIVEHAAMIEATIEAHLTVHGLSLAEFRRWQAITADPYTT